MAYKFFIKKMSLGLCNNAMIFIHWVFPESFFFFFCGSRFQERWSNLLCLFWHTFVCCFLKLDILAFELLYSYLKRILLLLILLLLCVHSGTKDGLLSVPSKVSLSGQVVELDSGCLILIVVWLFIISL